MTQRRESGPPKGRGGVMTMQCLKYPQVQGLCIPSWGLFVNTKQMKQLQGFGPS